MRLNVYSDDPTRRANELGEGQRIVAVASGGIDTGVAGVDELSELLMNAFGEAQVGMKVKGLKGGSD